MLCCALTSVYYPSHHVRTYPSHQVHTYTSHSFPLGMTTGSLPTFVDISTNFGSAALFENNFIDIMREKEKK